MNRSAGEWALIVAVVVAGLILARVLGDAWSLVVLAALVVTIALALRQLARARR